MEVGGIEGRQEVSDENVTELWIGREVQRFQAGGVESKGEDKSNTRIAHKEVLRGECGGVSMIIGKTRRGIPQGHRGPGDRRTG